MKMSLKSKMKALPYLLYLVAFPLAANSVGSAPEIPNPKLYLTRTETVQRGKQVFIEYHYDVFNKAEYPAEMFAPAPTLPPCGKNTKASRTWVDFYDQSGKVLNSFCALSNPGDLDSIYFVLEEGTVPPGWIYIELNDRQTNTKYKSNLAETSL